MENFSQQPKSAGTRAWAVVLLSVAITLVTVFLPVCLLLLPALWAYAALKTRPAYLALFGAVLLGGSLLLYTPLMAACMTAFVCVSAWLLCWLQTGRTGNVYTALALSGVAAVCLYLVFCLPGILSGEGAFAAIQAEADQIMATWEELLQSMPEITALPADTVKTYMQAFRDTIASMVVPMVCMFGGIAGLSNLLFFRLFSRKQAAAFGLVPLRPFRMWAIPHNLTSGLFFLLIGALALELFEWDYSVALTNTVNIIVSMPLMLQGLCVIDYFLYSKSKNVVAARVIAYIAIGLLIWILQMPLMVLGCFEQIFRLRTRMAAGAAQSKMPPFDKM